MGGSKSRFLILVSGLFLFCLLIKGVIATIDAYQYHQDLERFGRYWNYDYARKALAANPNDGYAYEGIANHEVMQHQYNAAVNDFRKAWQLNPDNHRASGELAAELIDQHRYAEAAQVQQVMATYHDSWGDAARRGLASYERYRKKHPDGK